MSTPDTLERNLRNEAEEVREGIEQAGRKMEQTGRKLGAQAENAWDDLIDTVKRHPAKAIGVTLAAGFAVGTLAAAASRRRPSATEHLRDLAGTGADAWDRVRGGFEEAICTLRDAVNDAVSKFK